MSHVKSIFVTLALAVGVHSIVASFMHSPNEPTLSPESTSPALSAVVAPLEESKQTSEPVTRKFTKAMLHDSRRKLDLVFCVDTTSSMQGEIDTVKSTVKKMVSQLSTLQKAQVRVGLVAYRDIGDDYVTKVFPFASDIDKVVHDISGLEAQGGGDGPESVEKGLHSALYELSWDKDKETAKLLFLIGDAPPHDNVDWKKECAAAVEHGIQINTIGCEGIQDYGSDGVPMFKKVAAMTNGNYQALTYHQEIADKSGKVHTFVSSAGSAYEVKPEARDEWSAGGEALVANGKAVALQGATNGTIGPQGADATYVTGVNTAGTVRSDNNLGSVIVNTAGTALDRLRK